MNIHFSTVGIVGSGAMGRGIAQICAQAGSQVRLLDAQPGMAISLDELERLHIERVLASSDSLDAAARTLGIDASTLYRKRKLFGL